MIRNSIKNICCIGAGYVGGPTMAVIADKCPNLNIYVVDKNQSRIKAWNSKDLEKLPVYEPGLKEIVERVRFKNLFFSSDIIQNIRKADAIFISVNTPIKTSGLGAGQASNLRWVEACTNEIAEYAEGHTIVIEKSTLPVRTAEIIKKILSSKLNKKNIRKTFSILSNPEFLAEGTAIDDLEDPDRVLIGGDEEDAINQLKEIYEKWVDPKKILTTNLWSSELSKLVANAFLAQRISSINSISALCEKTGADITEVSRAVGFDSRIGAKFLKAGPGFGGSCFKKDILNLVYLSRYFGLNETADFWEQVLFINKWQKERIYSIIVNKLFGNITNKKILILGFSFKANTNDIRESPAIEIAQYLLSEGANLLINDPKVDAEQIEISLNRIKSDSLKKDQNEYGIWSFEKDIYQAFRNADAAIIITEWDVYKTIDWQKVSNLMNSPAWIFDTRSIISGEDVRSAGLEFWSVGNGNYI
tara:strand:- start:33 stop:1454 length:1422 start_codon:yes stop_codon:yes gene_type:complete